MSLTYLQPVMIVKSVFTTVSSLRSLLCCSYKWFVYNVKDKWIIAGTLPQLYTELIPLHGNGESCIVPYCLHILNPE